MHKFDLSLLLWGAITSVISLLSWFVASTPDLRILFSYVVLALVLGGALLATGYITVKSR